MAVTRRPLTWDDLTEGDTVVLVAKATGEAEFHRGVYAGLTKTDGRWYAELVMPLGVSLFVPVRSVRRIRRIDGD